MVGSALYNGYDRHSGRLSGKNLPKFASTSSKSRSLSQSDKTRQLSTEPNAPPPLPPKPKQVTYTKPARMQDTKGLYSGDAVQGLDNLFSTSAQSVSSSSGGITPGKPLVSSVNVEKRDKSILSTITKGISKAQVQKYEQVEESSLREEAAAPNSIREGKLIKIDGSGNEVLYYFILTVKCFCYTELKSVGDVEKLRVYPTTNLMAL